MGCNTSADIQKVKQKLQVRQKSSKVGKLAIKLLNYDFIENDNEKQKYLQVRVSNQSFISSIHHNFSSDSSMKIDQTFNFIINSKLKKYGRMMTIQIWSKQDLRVDKQFALGIVDLDPILNRKTIHNQLNPQENKIKCFVNYEKIAAGKINLTAQFFPYQYRKVTLKIDSVQFRQHFIRERPIYIRTTIGQEIFQTSQSFQTLKQSPKWDNSYYVFYVPDFLSQCLIQVLQKNKANSSDTLIGELNLDLKTFINLMSQNPIQNYSQQIQIDDQVTGVIKFQVFEGQIQSQTDLSEPGSSIKISQNQDQKKITSINIIKDQINQKANDKIAKPKQKNIESILTIQSTSKKIPSLSQSHLLQDSTQKTAQQIVQPIKKTQKKKSLINSLKPIIIQQKIQEDKNLKSSDKIQEAPSTQQIKINPVKKSELKIKKTESFGLNQNQKRIKQNPQNDQAQFIIKTKASTEKIIQKSNKQAQNQEQSPKHKVFENSILKIDMNDQSIKVLTRSKKNQDQHKAYDISKQSNRKLLESDESQTPKQKAEDQEWQKVQIKKIIQ